MDIHALVNEKIEADSEFQTSLESLDDVEREEALSAKREEVLTNEFISLKEQADKATKAEELANNYKIRAEKAEKSVKPGDAKTEGLSAKDFLALKDANITADDFDEVQDFASFKKISVAEALGNDTLKSILADKQEKRNTAKATQIKGGRGTVKTTPDELLSKARRGEIPEDDAGIEALTKAREEQRNQRL